MSIQNAEDLYRKFVELPDYAKGLVTGIMTAKTVSAEKKPEEEPEEKPADLAATH